jgi:hypothetical protein
MRLNIIEMNVLITPLEVMNNSLISQFFLNYENVLKEIDYSLFDIEMVKLGNHSLLVLQIPFVLVN